MIVIALIATALGAMALPISKALKGEHFASGVDAVIGKITLAQALMLDFHTDVRLNLKLDEGKIDCRIDTGIPLPLHIAKAINHRSKIAGITEMAFDDQVKNDIEICFEGSLGSMSKGTLSLMGPGLEEKIVLLGYPGQIRRGNHVQARSCSAAYPEEILSPL